MKRPTHPYRRLPGVSSGRPTPSAPSPLVPERAELKGAPPPRGPPARRQSVSLLRPRGPSLLFTTRFYLKWTLLTAYVLFSTKNTRSPRPAPSVLRDPGLLLLSESPNIEESGPTSSLPPFCARAPCRAPNPPQRAHQGRQSPSQPPPPSGGEVGLPGAMPRALHSSPFPDLHPLSRDGGARRGRDSVQTEQQERGQGRAVTEDRCRKIEVTSQQG